MVTKKQRRAAKQLRNTKKQKKKFSEFLKEIIEKSDIILEVLDARFIEETRNNEIEQLIKKRKKKIIYVLNKSDLITKKNRSALENIKPYIFVSALERKGGRELRNKIKTLARTMEKDTEERFAVGVIGYPNTGKSSIINLLIGKSSAKTGASAGFTKGIQKLKLTNEIVLLDSPGIIPEREYSPSDKTKISYHAEVGARDYHKVKDPEIVISYIFEKYKKSFQDFYNLKVETSDELIEQFGKKKNVLKKGGIVDEDRTARLILKDWQEGKIKI